MDFDYSDFGHNSGDQVAMATSHNQLTVVGLGPVTASVVQPILDGARFIENPTTEDLSAASAAIVRAAYSVDRALMAAMPNLKILARTGVGYDLIDVAAADELGIAVAITPGSNSAAVAEGVMAHILTLSKRLQPLTKLVASGKFAQRDIYPVGDLAGATLGIVGYGRIGKRVAELATAFDMKVVAYDPFAEIPKDRKIDSFKELLAVSDIVTLHVPLTNENRSLIRAESISTMKDGAILINCSRGGLVDLDALYVGLESGKLLGVGLDVFDPEPPVHHKLFDHENVVLTPHVMGLSKKATIATYIDAARAVRAVLDGKEPEALVNSLSYTELIQKRSTS